jgi:uncharacterized protein (TIGR04255 family)
MSRKDLKNKPLVEALLEVKWELPVQQVPGIGEDPHYRLLLGRLSERVESDYPFHEALPTAQVPDALVAHMAQHRFRVSRDGWPLVQVGPGLMTVNETEGYVWEDFRERCAQAVTNLFSAHPDKQKLRIQDLTLRYIDAVNVDFRQESAFKFLQEKMQTNILLPDALFDGERVKRNPTAFNWQASFPNELPGGLMTLRFAVGTHRDRPALIWETLVQTAREDISTLPDGFLSWLDQAHELTDDWFFKLIEGELERRFSGE